MDTETNAPLDSVSRFLHLGLAVFGVWAWLIGSGWIGAGAGDYKKPDHFWYTQHMWVGMTFTAFLLARILWGFVGPESARFRNWVPWKAALSWEIARGVLNFLDSGLRGNCGKRLFRVPLGRLRHESSKHSATARVSIRS